MTVVRCLQQVPGDFCAMSGGRCPVIFEVVFMSTLRRVVLTQTTCLKLICADAKMKRVFLLRCTCKYRMLAELATLDTKAINEMWH